MRPLGMQPSERPLDFYSPKGNDLLATRESARGAVSHLSSLYLYIYAKNKSGERTPWAVQLRR
jgi:hypothetical protein